ncbi:MAG: hypothetical protein GY765_16225 [bacterium]|nr:hypothetical protein [bacterium]
MVIGIFVFSFHVSGQTTPDVGNKQYIQVTLKSGATHIFQYRSFMEGNFQLEAPNKRLVSKHVKGELPFSLSRVDFTDTNACKKVSIGLANLRELEVLGVKEDSCSGQTRWVFKVSLLDLRKYEGYFQFVNSAAKESGEELGLNGEALDSAEAKDVKFKDIKKINFFPR